MGEWFNKLKPHEKRAVDQYLISFNFADTAKAKRSRAKNLTASGKSFIARPEIQRALDERRKELAQQYEVSPERIIGELSKIAFFNPKDILNEAGRITPEQLNDIDPHEFAAIKEIKPNKDGDLTLKFHSKSTAIDMLARHLGMFERDNTQKAGRINIVPAAINKDPSSGVRPPKAAEEDDFNPEDF